MKEYARQRGLKRLVISVPLLTPRLSSLWLGLVTPLYVRVGRKLIDSICHETIVEDRTALTEFNIRPCGYREAIAAALKRIRGIYWSIRGPSTSRLRRRKLSPPSAALAVRQAGITRIGCGDCVVCWTCCGVVLDSGAAPRSGFAQCWRYCGFLARGGAGTRSPSAAGRGDETSRPCLAGVRSDP